MAAFEYSALNPTGTTERGVLEADSERHARRLLRGRELTPLNVAPAHEKRGRTRQSLLRSGRMSGEQLGLFTRLLATLLRSGLPLDDALGILRKQSESQAIEKIVLAVRAKVREGHSLETALDEHPRAFPDVYRATVGAGEQTRLLPVVLEQLADYVERREQVIQRVRIAMVYPAVLVVTAFAVVTGLLAYVVPEVVRVFDDVGRTLPAITRFLIALSDATRSYGVAGLGVGAVLIATLYRLYQRPAVKYRAHLLVMKLPLLGRALIEFDSARFASTLGILLDSGVDMLDALTIASRSVVLHPYRAALAEATVRVREGAALHVALGAERTVPGLLEQLVASGENSGELPRMLATSAETFDRKTERYIAVLLGLVEPLLIFSMGAIILFIVIAIMLPIFEMNQFV